MAKKIVPHKLIVSLNEDGTFKSGILQYRIRVDGVLDNKYLTMSIADITKTVDVGAVLSASKTHIEKGENINATITG
jgi:hypothetical protein